MSSKLQRAQEDADTCELVERKKTEDRDLDTKRARVDGQKKETAKKGSERVKERPTNNEPVNLGGIMPKPNREKAQNDIHVRTGSRQ